MVELTMLAPLLFAILFAVIQFGILYNDYVTLTDATRAGARKAAVSRLEADPAGVAKRAVQSSASDLDPTELVVSVTPGTPWERSDDVTVAATYPYEIDLFGLVVASGNLQSETTERVE